MIRNSLLFILLIAVGIIFYSLFVNFTGNDGLQKTAKYYAEKENIEQVNAANLVTAVVVTYRGLDTLGEVTILFLTAAIIGFFLKTKQTSENKENRTNSEILETASPVFRTFVN